jgi:lysozyme C
MLLLNIFLLSLQFSKAFNANSFRGSKNPDTVNELNVEQYLGNWYQTYGAPTNVIFQGYGKCLTAQYGLLDNGDVSVLNSQINSNGKLEQISGYAYYTNSSEPGKLTVHLDGVPTDSPYWVLKLGEVVNNQYQYAIISVPSGISLWVLTRDIETFYSKYDEEVKDYLEDNNFKYETIVQDDTCEYVFEATLEENYKTECQVSSYLKAAGFPQSSLSTMVCISKYESSFNCDATNKNTDGSTDYGLMQINSYWWCSGDPLSKYNGCSATCSSLFDCQSNANCAYIVWKQQGYNAWYGYKNHKAECDNYKLNC